MALTLDKGIVGGRDHIVYGLNCQDSVVAQTVEIEGETYIIGFVADGCGEFKRNETGAHLTTSFLIVRTIDLLKKRVPILEIPDRLYMHLVAFLSQIINCYISDEDSYALAMAVVKEHLLATALGFIIGPEDTVVFGAGDGVIVLNDIIDIRDQDNRPTYPAYHAISDRYLQKPRSEIKFGFDVFVQKTANVHRLAVGSDAWKDELTTLMEFLGDKRPVNLQRAMNVLSNKHKRFKDDASIIIVTRIDEEGGTDESTSG